MKMHYESDTVAISDTDSDFSCFFVDPVVFFVREEGVVFPFFFSVEGSGFGFSFSETSIGGEGSGGGTTVTSALSSVLIEGSSGVDTDSILIGTDATGGGFFCSSSTSGSENRTRLFGGSDFTRFGSLGTHPPSSLKTGKEPSSSLG